MNRPPAASDAGRERGNWRDARQYCAGGGALNVADAGCGAGEHACLWAAHGHQVYGAERDGALVALARRRAAAAGLDILFDHADCAALPWPDRSMDVCIAPAAVARVAGAELVRVLRPGGVLYIRGAKPASPALHWFAFHWLRRRLARRGLRAVRCVPGAPWALLAMVKPAR